MTDGAGHHHHHSTPGELTSVESHLADILGSIRPLPPTQLAIPEAEGCVLAEDITASRPLPPFDNSAMDGYALISADVTDALLTLAKRGHSGGGGVHGVLFHGRRYDTGNKLDYLRTLVQFACERSDLAEEIVPWLRKYLDSLP